ncbi:MAG TPA: HIT family protein [Candidatus Nanoarchaeia archaeon]|nr:HIT family protein [Candidatus Nanoarchaeia archaeon]
MENCIFCKIIKKEIASNVVYEDAHTFAFLDNNPMSKGHTLVMPKKHFTNIFDMPEQEACAVMASIKQISIALKKSLHAEGINILQNNEKIAGQLVMHSHTHVIPRYQGDTVQIDHGPRMKLSSEDMNHIASTVKKAL